jgi:hypothetical protein
MNKLCEYGCGLPAINQLKNGKFCCSKHNNSCPENKKKNAEGLKQSYESGVRKPAGYVYEKLSDDVKKRMAWSRGKSSYDDTRIKNKYSDDQIFKENTTISNKVVKSRLMSNPNFEHKCELCSTKEWYDPFESKTKPVNLELDHINGNERDNRKENLRLICSNCHSFTPTYKGRNINKFLNRGDRKVSDEILLQELKTKNIRQSLISVGLCASGENYERCKILKSQLTSEENVVR